jgi:predicted nucleic acid-binding Zn ribbon protein
MKPSTDRHCQQCGKTLHGRLDKKFCDDYCRNTYNNQLQLVESPQVRLINSFLKKNRKLLMGCIPDGEEMAQVPRQRLADAGFNFTYHTHQYTTKKGGVYAFVYEYGYLLLEGGDRLLVVRRQVEGKPIAPRKSEG